jgi:hypothetical protein
MGARDPSSHEGLSMSALRSDRTSSYDDDDDDDDCCPTAPFATWPAKGQGGTDSDDVPPRGDHLVRAYDDDGALRPNDDDDDDAASSPRRCTGSRVGESVDT